MPVTLALDNESGRWTITSGDDSVEITSARGRALSFSSSQSVLGVFENVEGENVAGYVAFIETDGRRGLSYSRYEFGADGRLQSRRPESLDTLGLVAAEDEFDSDLNGDGAIGFQTQGDALSRNGGSVEAYALSNGAIGIVTDAGGADETVVPLLGRRGDVWLPGGDRDVVAVRSDGTGWKIVTEEEHRGSKRYFEFSVAEDGTVARRASLLSEFEVVALEGEYGGSINGETTEAEELAVEFQKASEARLDRGSGDASIWEISGGGYGVIVIDENGEDTFFALKNSDGSRFMPAEDQSVVAVRQDGDDFLIILETVRPLSTTYIELAVSADGTVARRGDVLRGNSLGNAEVDYRTDVDDDGIITVPAGRTFELRLDPEAEVPLNFQGSTGTIILDGEEFGADNTLTLRGNGAVQVKNFSGTLDGSGMSANLDVAAVGAVTITAQAATGDITVTGDGGPLVVNNLSNEVDASGTSGELMVNTVADSDASVITGSGATTVNSGDNNAEIDADALAGNDLTVTGSGTVSVTNLAQDVVASSFEGTFSATTKSDATLTVTTGSGGTTLTSDGSGTITVKGAALGSADTLELNGSSSYTSNDVSETSVAYKGSSSLTLTPQGAVSLDLDTSTGDVSVGTSGQGAGRLTVDNIPTSGPDIDGAGAVTLNVAQAGTSLAEVAATTDLTVAISGPGSTSLTAAQANGSSVSGLNGSFDITDAAPASDYDFSNVSVPGTSLTFTGSGTLATTQFGSIDQLVLSGDHTVTMTTSQVSGRSLTADGGNKIVFDLADGDDLDVAVPVANMPTNFDLALQDDATATMRGGQHENAASVSGNGTERIVLSSGGTVNARDGIESYEAQTGALTLVVSSEETGVNVYGNALATTVDVGTLTVTGVYDLGGGANALLLEDGADITGVKASDGGTAGAGQIAATMTVAGTVAMTSAQHVTGITAEGGSDRVVLTKGGSTDTVTAAAAIETYELAETGLGLNLSASNLSADVVGSADNGTISLGSNAWTGDFQLGAGHTLDLTSGADISGINGGKDSTAGTITFSGSATMTASQHDAVGTLTANDGRVIVQSGVASDGSAVTAFSARSGVGTYELDEAGLTVTIVDGAASVNVDGSTGADTIVIAESVAATGSYAFSNGDDVLQLSGGANTEGATVTGTYQLNLADSAGVVITTAQHAAASNVGADSTNVITFRDAADATARSEADYKLADGDQTFTLANAVQKVTTGTGTVTVATGGVTSFTTAAVTGTSSTTTLLIDADSDVTGLSLADVDEIDLANNVDATVSLSQNALIDTAAGTNAITLSTAGAATGAAEVESYVLASGDQTFTLGATGQGVQATGGTVTLNTGSLASYNGTVTGSVDALVVPDNAGYVNLTSLSAASLSNIGRIEVGSGAQVHLTGAQADGYTVQGDGDVIVQGATGSTDLSGLTVSGGVTVKTTGSAELRGDGDLSTVDTFEMQGGSINVMSPQLGSAVIFEDGNVTVTVNENIETDSYTFDVDNSNTIALADGADISDATLSNFSRYDIPNDVTARMTVAQHGAAAFGGPGSSSTATIEFSDSIGTDDPLQGSSAVGAYILADLGPNTFNLGGAGQDVTGGTSDDTVRVGSFTPGTIDLGAGANTIALTRGNSLVPAGEPLATGGSYEIHVGLGVETDAVTLSRAQNDNASDIILEDGSALVLAINDGGALTARANVTEYELSAHGNTLALADDSLSVDVTGGVGNDEVQVGGRSVTGVYALGGGSNTVSMTTGADISGATLTIAGGETLVGDLSGSVTMSVADYNAFTGFTGSDATVTLTTGGTITADDAFSTYNLSDSATSVFLTDDMLDIVFNGGSAADTVFVGGFAVSGNFQLGGGANLLRLADGADVTGATIAATGGSFGFTITGGASVTMGAAQHIGASDLTGTSIARVTLTGTGDVTGDVDVLAYTLNGQDFTVAHAAQDVTVASGSGEITLLNGTSATGDYTFAPGSTYTLVLEPDVSIAGVNGGAAVGASALSFEGTASMTAVQHDAFVGNISGTADRIELTTQADVSGDAAVKAYTLADGDQTFTLGAAGQSVTTGTGNVTVDVDGLTLTAQSSLDGTAADLTVAISGTTDLSAAALTGVNAMTVANGATVTLTAAQADGLSVTGGGNVIVTALGGSEADLSGIDVTGDVSLDAGNPDPVLGAGFTFGDDAYAVIGAGTLDITAVTQDLSGVTGFDVAAVSDLRALQAQVDQIGIADITGTGTLGITAEAGGSTLDGSGAGLADVVLYGGAGADTFVFGDGVSVDGFEGDQDKVDVAAFGAPVAIDELDWSGRSSASGATRTLDVDASDATVTASAASTTLFSNQGLFSWAEVSVGIAGDYRFGYSLTTDQGARPATLGFGESSNDNDNLLGFTSGSVPSTRSGDNTFPLVENETLRFNFSATESGGNADMTLVLELLDAPNAPLPFDDIARANSDGNAVLTIDGASLTLLGSDSGQVVEDWFIFG